MSTWRVKREEITNKWIQDRDKHGYTSRKYMLWSFFETLLTAILDPKDWKAIRIKTDPAYLADPEFRNRTEWESRWHYNRI